VTMPPEYYRQYARRWTRANPPASLKNARRQRNKQRGFPVPPWRRTVEDREAIDAAYANCPPGLTVDHVAPLKHAEIIGLHVLENLAYLSRSDNSRKGCKLPEGLTPAKAVARGLAIWRRDVDPVTGEVNWEPYRPQ
jgi:hypothetical protein